MRHPPLRILTAISLVFALGCLGLCNREREGDDAGECSDGADNDLDGLFDCDDDECAGSPDCDEPEDSEPLDSDTPIDTGETDTDADADADSDTDADADADADSDADADPYGLYEGVVDGVIGTDWHSMKCAGWMEIDITPDGEAEGWALCESQWSDLEGEVTGWAEGPDFEGTWSVTVGSWGGEDVDITLVGSVDDELIQLTYYEDASSYWLEGSFDGVRVD